MAIGLKALFGYVGYALTAKDVLNTLEMLINQEESYIRIVADTDRRTALQEIKAARNGNYKIHMGVALGHLKHAYNLLHEAANRKAHWYEWLDDFTTGVSSRTHDSRDTYAEIVELAAMISRGHRSMGEGENAKDWANKARRAFQEYKGLAEAIGSCPNIGSAGMVGGGLYAEGPDEDYLNDLRKRLKIEGESLEKLLSA
ncbi:MAG TPA: hypothetical protein VF659_23895 [Pyrinomonadaceae bacterium]|jgi:hypothetical protein